MDGRYRKNIHKGQYVNIVLKKDQKSGKLTYGKVERILTNKAYHSRGIKCRILGTGSDKERVGRVAWIPDIK